MSKQKLPKEFLAKLQAVTAKRAKRVIDHILKHGLVTTQELRDQYGYNHPPRGAQDVKDLGIPLKMVRVLGEDGRKIAAYTFGDPSQARFGALKGRVALSKKLKSALISSHGARCAITHEELAEKDLQIDHRIPYQVAGDNSGEPSPDDFMLLSRSANRSKSWACEHCDNFVNTRDPGVCATCYWANPSSYQHVALKPERRLDVAWTNDDTVVFDYFTKAAEKQGLSANMMLKELVKEYVAGKK